MNAHHLALPVKNRGSVGLEPDHRIDQAHVVFAWFANGGGAYRSP